MPKLQSQIFVVEGEPDLRQEILDCLHESGFVTCGSAGNAREGLAGIVAQNATLALIEINLPGEGDGLWLAEELRKQGGPPVVFLTSESDPEKLAKARATSPAGLVFKPFSEAGLQATLTLAESCSGYEEPHPNPIPGLSRFFARTEAGLTRIDVEEVHYLEACDNYVNLFLERERLLIRSSLRTLMDKLEGSDIVRCHRTYAVNLSRIKSLTATHLLLPGKTLPLGRHYKDALMKRLVLV